jgi:hypothetical protein
MDSDTGNQIAKLQNRVVIRVTNLSSTAFHTYREPADLSHLHDEYLGGRSV